MDAVIEHTYWDKNFKEDPQFGDKFFQAIGNSSANSKIWFRQWLKLNPEITSFKNCLDIGCGPATEFEGFKNDEITIDYTGVDSSAHLCEFSRQRGVTMIEAPAHSVPVEDSSYELVMSRHVLEHNPDFRPILNEMIRSASKLATHTFFEKPREEQKIQFDSASNIFWGNVYKMDDINEFLDSHPKVASYEWLDINNTENIVMIWINNQ